MLSLAAMLAVLSYASPASAELKFGGDAAIRLRGSFTDSELNNVHTDNEDDLLFQYRVRLKAAADLGSGYFFKTMIQSEEDAKGAAVAGGWAGVGNGNVGAYNLEISNFYFGRMMEESHYMIGRLPLNSFNNPIFDIALYPVPGALPITGAPIVRFTGSSITAVDVPVATYNFDRIFGLNYGTKVGGGDLNATLVVFDNAVGDDYSATDLKGNGLFNDGYALHLAYKTTIGNVTFEPQAIITLTDGNGSNYLNVSPNTFGANLTIPAGKAKIGLSGFYTVCDDSDGARVTQRDPANPSNIAAYAPAHVDYSGYLLRLKGEVGPFMAWIDYNQTDDNTVGNEAEYDNLFVWAQYNFKVYESAMGTFSLTPTVRYRASGQDQFGVEKDYSQLRTELYATVTF